MKEFLKRVLTSVIVVGVFASPAIISACKSGETVAARLAVSYATAKYIEKGGTGAPGRAARVIAVADTIEDVASGEAVTIDALKTLALSKLPESLSPADRVLAGALIDAAVAELQARVGDGVLKPDQLIRVREVLKWVREGATQFVPVE